MKEEQLRLGQKVGKAVKGQNTVTLNRHLYTGGSDLPNILGYATKYGTTPFMWAKIKAGIVDNPFKGNEHTKYGQKMEPIIRDYFNAVNDYNFKEDHIIDEETKFRSNCDGLDAANDALLEIKTFKKELDVEYYTPQIQMYLEMFNISQCWLVGYSKPEDFYIGLDYNLENDDTYFNFDFDESRLIVYRIQRDRDLWANVYAQIVRFNNGVKALKDNHNLSEEEFYKIYYGDEITIAANKLITIENKLKAFKELEKEQKSLKDNLYKLFNENGFTSFENDSIKITKVEPTTTRSLDSIKLKKEQPDIYNNYLIDKERSGYIKITLREEK